MRETRLNTSVSIRIKHKSSSAWNNSEQNISHVLKFQRWKYLMWSRCSQWESLMTMASAWPIFSRLPIRSLWRRRIMGRRRRCRTCFLRRALGTRVKICFPLASRRKKRWSWRRSRSKSWPSKDLCNGCRRRETRFSKLEILETSFRWSKWTMSAVNTETTSTTAWRMTNSFSIEFRSNFHEICN